MPHGLPHVVHADMKFVTPWNDTGFVTNGAHGVEAQTAAIRVALSFCKLHRTAVDVGAHIGIWTNELANRFDTVWAFEPNAENFECLRQNIGTRAHLQNLALGEGFDTGGVTLPPGGNSGMWHIDPAGDGVTVRRLDDYMLECVDFIKIDTEGYEGKVVQGARRTLNACRPVVFFEDNGLGTKYYGNDWVDPKPVLVSLGYSRVARIRKDEIWMPV